jgi:hypothetical protein
VTIFENRERPLVLGFSQEKPGAAVLNINDDITSNDVELHACVQQHLTGFEFCVEYGYSVL